MRRLQRGAPRHAAIGAGILLASLVFAAMASAPALASGLAVQDPFSEGLRSTPLPEVEGTVCPEGGDLKSGCLVGWDHGAAPGPGDDAVTVGVLVRLAPGLVVDAASQNLAVPASPGLAPALPWLAADQDPDELARALVGKLEPLRAASPVHAPAPQEGKQAPSDQTEMFELSAARWHDLFPSLGVQAGVSAAPRSAAPLAAAGPDGGLAGAASDALDAARAQLRPADAAGRGASTPQSRGPAPFAPAVAGPAPTSGHTLSAAAAEPLGPPPSTALVGSALGASLAFAWGLYTRIAAHRALDQGTRRRIYDLVAQQPGVRVGTLRRQLGLSYPAVERHVRMLVHFGLLEVHPGGQRRLFVRGSADAGTRAAVVASSTPQARLVLDHLRTRGPATMGALRAELGLPRSSASLVVQRLSAAGLVVALPQGRKVLVALPTQVPAEQHVSLAPAPQAPVAVQAFAPAPTR